MCCLFSTVNTDRTSGLRQKAVITFTGDEPELLKNGYFLKKVSTKPASWALSSGPRQSRIWFPALPLPLRPWASYCSSLSLVLICQMGRVTVSTAQDYHDDSVPGLYKYYALYFLC